MLLTLLHSEWPKLYGVFAILSAVGLKVEHRCEKIIMCHIQPAKVKMDQHGIRVFATNFLVEESTDSVGKQQRL